MEEKKIKLEQPADPTTETFNPNVKGGNSWQELTGKPDAYVLNQINKDGIVERIDAKTIRSGKITGTTLQTGESGARVIIGGSGDDSNDIHLLDDSTGGTTPITGNTASINFKRTDDNTQIFKIQKRAGKNYDDENIAELFFDKDANNSKQNYIFLGKKGDGTNSDIHTDIVQVEVKDQINLATKNNAGIAEFTISTTEHAGATAGGSSIGFYAYQATTDIGAANGAFIAFSVMDNASAVSGNTFMYVDKNGVYLEEQVETGITASHTISQGQAPLTKTINQITTVAYANDCVTLPSAIRGMKVIIINDTANDMWVFAASGDGVGRANSSVLNTPIGAYSIATFYAIDNARWRCFQSASLA